MNRDYSTGTQRVLVTGGGGFIGRHLVDALLADGQDVAIASRHAVERVGARIFSVDLTRPDEIGRLLDEIRPTTVFNLAGQRESASSADHRTPIDINLVAAMDLARKAADRGSNRIILLGSAEEYGDQPMPVDELAALRPASLYGASKAAMTLHAMALRTLNAAPVVVVRPFSVYGPGAPKNMFLTEAADCAARGAPFRMTDGQQRRDFIYVTDVVRGLLLAASAPTAVGEVFNLGCGVSHSMKDVAEALWRISGTSAELQIGARAKPAGDLKETCANIERARNILGWQPHIGLEEGLRLTWLAAKGPSGGGV